MERTLGKVVSTGNTIVRASIYHPDVVLLVERFCIVQQRFHLAEAPSNQLISQSIVEYLSMAHFPPGSNSQAPAAKAHTEFAEDLEAVKTASSRSDNGHIERVELTPEEVC